MGTEKSDLKAVKCAKCGGELVKSFRTEYDDEDEENVSVPVAKCSSCGVEYDRKTDEYYSVFADDLTADRDNSVFKLGVKGTLRGVEYEIVGRLRYQDEDEWEKSTWDEWFAVAADGTYHYFVEEEGEVHSYDDYTPQSIDIESDPATILFDGKKISKSEAYVGRIVLAEGELPWKPEIGEPSTMYDFKKDGAKYTIEQSEDEVSITRGEKLSYNEVVAAFGGEKEKKLFHATAGSKKQYQRKAVLYAVCGAISFVLAAMSCLNTSPVGKVMDAKHEIASNEVLTEGGQRMYQSEVLYGPFDISPGNNLYNASVSVVESVKKLNLEWQSFRLLLVPEERLNKTLNNRITTESLKALFDEVDALRDPVECYTFGGDFWGEEGYDDEGHWHENDLSVSDDFIVEKAGRYYVYLELTSQNPRPIDSVAVRIERVRSYRYFLIVAGVFVALAFYNRTRAKAINLG